MNQFDLERVADNNASTPLWLLLSAREDFREGIIRFFSDGNFSPATRRNYLGCMRRFGVWLKAHDLSIEELRAPHIAGFIESLGTGPARRRGMLAFVKSFLGSLEVQGLLDRNAASSIKPSKNPYRLEGATPEISEGDLQKLMTHLRNKALHEASPVALRDYALASVLLDTWSRISAVCSLRIGDHYLAGSQPYLRFEEKGRKIQTKSIDLGVHEIIGNYIEHSGISGAADGFLFRSAKGRSGRLSEAPLSPRGAREIIRLRGEEAGLRGLHPHMFRVSGFNRYRRLGGIVDTARLRMGHENSSMTISYERQALMPAEGFQFSMLSPTGSTLVPAVNMGDFSGMPSGVNTKLGENHPGLMIEYPSIYFWKKPWQIFVEDEDSDR